MKGRLQEPVQLWQPAAVFMEIIRCVASERLSYVFRLFACCVGHSFGLMLYHRNKLFLSTCFFCTTIILIQLGIIINKVGDCMCSDASLKSWLNKAIILPQLSSWKLAEWLWKTEVRMCRLQCDRTNTMVLGQRNTRNKAARRAYSRFYTLRILQWLIDDSIRSNMHYTFTFVGSFCTWHRVPWY